MKDFVIFVLSSAVAVWGFVSCETSDWRTAQKAEDARKAAAEAKPHVIREADGCKVYAWKSYGTEHFFTSCAPNETVTTERHYRVNCGKACTRDESESIVTPPQAKP